MSDEVSIAGIRLRFWIRGDVDVPGATGVRPPSLSGRVVDYETFFARRGLVEAEALQAALQSKFPTLKIRVRARLGPPKVGGPGAAESLLSLLLLDDPIGRIADYLGIVGGLGLLLRWLREHETGGGITLEDGTAVLVAMGAVFDSTQLQDLTLESVIPIRPASDPYDVDGYLVGFTGGGSIFQVPAFLDGSTGNVTEIRAPESPQPKNRRRRREATRRTKNTKAP